MNKSMLSEKEIEEKLYHYISIRDDFKNNAMFREEARLKASLLEWILSEI